MLHLIQKPGGFGLSLPFHSAICPFLTWIHPRVTGPHYIDSKDCTDQFQSVLRCYGHPEIPKRKHCFILISQAGCLACTLEMMQTIHELDLDSQRYTVISSNRAMIPDAMQEQTNFIYDALAGLDLLPLVILNPTLLQTESGSITRMRRLSYWDRHRLPKILHQQVV